MKRGILIFLSTLLLFSCKKDNSDGPVPFRLLTREIVLQSSNSYIFKGTIVGENVIHVNECGFLYSASAAFSSLPIDYYATGTNKITVYKDAAVTPGNFEAQTTLTSGQYYNVTTYAVIHYSSSNQDIVYTGSQLQIQVP